MTHAQRHQELTERGNKIVQADATSEEQFDNACQALSILEQMQPLIGLENYKREVSRYLSKAASLLN